VQREECGCDEQVGESGHGASAGREMSVIQAAG
jgi:hypothetical protein